MMYYIKLLLVFLFHIDMIVSGLLLIKCITSGAKLRNKEGIESNRRKG